MAYRTGLELSQFLPLKKEKVKRWEPRVLFGCFQCFFKSNKITITCHIPVLMHPFPGFHKGCVDS